MEPCNVEEEEGSPLFPVPFDVHVEIVISSCTVCSLFFTLWLTIRRTLPSAVAEYATFVICHREKKKEEPVLCEKSCDGGPLVVAQRKIFSPFKPPSTIATVNIRKHPVSMYGSLSSSIQMITTRCFSTPRRR